MRGMSGAAQSRRPLRGAVGRRGIAEIGREQHEAVERSPERQGGDAQGEAAAGGVADQDEPRLGIGAAEMSEEVGEVVVELGRDSRCRRASPRRRGRGRRWRPPPRPPRRGPCRPRSFRPTRPRSRARGSPADPSRHGRRDRADRRATCRRAPESARAPASPLRRSPLPRRGSRRAAAAGSRAKPAWRRASARRRRRARGARAGIARGWRGTLVKSILENSMSQSYLKVSNAWPGQAGEGNVSCPRKR